MELDAGSCMLRSWSLEDRGSLATIANDRRIWLNMTDTFPHPYMLEDADRWIAHCLEEGDPPLDFGIIVDAELAGGVGGHHGAAEQRDTINVGYWLTPDVWGRGTATDALRRYVEYLFDAFDPRRLYSTVFGWNPASARVLEKVGFRPEGRLREAVLKDGKVTDLLLYGLLQSERA
jgi:ribosomal-protein-alanine N-acetyltransferase